MRKLFVPAALFLSVLFFSCSDDLVINKIDTTDNMEWTAIDTTTLDRISDAVLTEENTLFVIRNSVPFKIENGISTFINLEDNDFIPDKVLAYNSSYVVFKGHSASTYQVRIKILKDGVVSFPSSMPQSGYLNDFIVYGRDKFALAADSTCYVYQSGAFVAHTIRSTSNPPFLIDNLFYRDNTLYCSASSNNYYGNINFYKIENGNVNYLSSVKRSARIIYTPENCFRLTAGYNTTNVEYFSGASWYNVFTTKTTEYLTITGETINYMYIIKKVLDSTYTPFKSYVWNGTNFLEQIDQPTMRTDLFAAFLTNMKNNVIYFIAYKENRSYIFKGKRVQK